MSKELNVYLGPLSIICWVVGVGLGVYFWMQGVKYLLIIEGVSIVYYAIARRKRKVNELSVKIERIATNLEVNGVNYKRFIKEFTFSCFVAVVFSIVISAYLSLVIYNMVGVKILAEIAGAVVYYLMNDVISAIFFKLVAIIFAIRLSK